MNTAQALYDQASDQVKAGTSPAIDGLRAQVELKTRQQQLIQAKNDFAIQKLTLARVIGLAPGQEYELTDKSPYEPFTGLTLDEAQQATGNLHIDAMDSETIRGTFNMVMSGGSNTMTVKRTLQGKWLGSDCGDVKPGGE